MNEIHGVLSVGGTSLFLFVGLVLVNCWVLSGHVLRSSRRRSLLLSLCLEGSSNVRTYSRRYPY